MAKINITRTIYDKVIEAETQEAKQKILEYYKKESLFRRIVYFIYHPLIDFGMKDFQGGNGKLDGMGISKFMHIIDDLVNGKLNREEAEFSSKIALNHINQLEAPVLRDVLTKTDNMKLEFDTINNVWPFLIIKYPVNEPATYYNDIEKDFYWPAIAQENVSGEHVHILVRGDMCEFKNMKGETIHELDICADQFKILAQSQHTVFDGAWVKVKGQDRFILWDAIRFDGFAKGVENRMGYNWRYNGLQHMCMLAKEKTPKPIYDLPKAISVNSLDEARQFGLKVKSDLVVKCMSSEWHSGVNTKQVFINMNVNT